MATQVEYPPARERHNLALWFGVLAGPVAWFVELILAYAWGWWACGFGRPLLPAHLTSAVCLALAIGGGAVAWREWQSVAGEPSEKDGGVIGYTRLLSVLGLLTEAFFSVVIIAEWIAVASLDPCPR